MFTETTTQTPDEYAVVEVVPGSSDLVIEREIVVEVSIHVKGRDRPRRRALDLGEEITTAMSALAASGTPDWYVDDVEETFSFAIDSQSDPGVRVARATYTLTVRPTH